MMKALETSQAKPAAGGAERLRGKIYSHALIREAPDDFARQAPYRLALVELEDGSLITAQLTDVDRDIEIGEPVEMVTRKLTTDGERGMIVYGYKFRPLLVAQRQ